MFSFLSSFFLVYTAIILEIFNNQTTECFFCHKRLSHSCALLSSPKREAETREEILPERNVECNIQCSNYTPLLNLISQI